MLNNIIFRIKQIPNEKKQKFMIIIFLFVLLITAILVRESFFKKSAVTTNILMPASFSSYVLPNINFKALEDMDLSKMKVFDKILPLEGSAGRTNPYIPF